MLVIIKPNAAKDQYNECLDHLNALPNIKTQIHTVQGSEKELIEIYLIGDTASLNDKNIKALSAVERVVRISDPYRVLGRHKDSQRHHHFDYNGVTFSQDNFNLFAGLCAVDNPKNVENMMKALQSHGQVCTRMGAYKPRTNPYSFQGHGKGCLPYVFELAGKHGIKVIAMEVTHESHIDEVRETLEKLGNPTGVMLQIGTRNTQNFELLKAAGRAHDFPVLIKRGFGITLDESLHATEYLASEGNTRVIFCLRGMKTNLADPHRNFVDFAHVPVIKRLTRMPVCIDPSHSVGSREGSPEGIMDVMHVAAQGIVSGANMVLVDFHPEPQSALVDGPQALRMNELEWFLDDIALARECYEKRKALAGNYQS